MRIVFRVVAVICVGWLCSANVSADPMVVNGDFEDGSFPTWPGYAGNGDNPAQIPGWTGTGGHGINPISSAHESPAPFNNGNNATQIAFLQGDSSIEQSIGGFAVGADYTLSLDFNARACCPPEAPGLPLATVFLNDVQLASSADLFPPPGGVVPTGAADDWYSADIDFTAEAETMTLRIVAGPVVGGTDATFIVDNIQIVPEPSAGVLTLLGLGAMLLCRRRK